MRTHVLGIDRVRYSHYCFIRHVQLDLLFVQLSLYHEPGNPDYEQCEKQEHIAREQLGFIKLSDFDQIERALLKSLLSRAVKDRQTESILAGGQIRVNDIIQAVLRHYGPLRVIAFEEISDIGFLNGIVQDLRSEFDTAYALSDRDRAHTRDRLLYVIHLYRRELHPVRTHIAVVFFNVDYVNARIAGKEQLSLPVVIVP